MTTTARQLSRLRPLPVTSGYLRPADRLQVSTSFAEAIIAKYKAPEREDLPSVRFAYSKTAALAAETLDRLASQMITLNRIRVNVHNHRWIQNYALTLENSCRVLLNELSFRAQTAPGAVSRISVRELERVFHEMEEGRAGDGFSGTAGNSGTDGMQGSAGISGMDGLQGSTGMSGTDGRPGTDGTEVPREEERILRILTAASRGNGMRERYMSMLYRRLQESAGPAGTGSSSPEILQGAVTELFQVGRLLPAMNGWASEEARQFFWRVQRAPEQERSMILQAAGHSTIISLERELRTMDRPAFRQFSAGLAEEIMLLPEFSGQSRGSDIPAGRLAEEMPEEDWNRFTAELAEAGFVFGEDSLYAPGEAPYWASEQARQLFWRIQRAPEQERQFFLEAGGFAGMENLEKLLHTMDDVTFRRFSAQLLERLTRFSGERSAGGEAAPEPALIKDTRRLLRGEQMSSALTAAEEKRIFSETAAGRTETAETLTRMLRDHAERTEILRENREAAEVLSETILNLTMDEWAEFREEMNSPEVQNMIPGEPDIVFAAADSDVHGDVQDILQQGIRMSREKRELIRTVYEMSVLPDHSFRTLERVLREKTILREHSIRENSRQYFRSLSARERENWADFVRDLLRGRENGGVSPEQVYLRMNGGQAAAAGIPEIAEILTDPERSSREAAGAVLEHLREARILAGERGKNGNPPVRTADAPAAASAASEQLRYDVGTPYGVPLNRGEPRGSRPTGASRQDAPALRPADMDVPRSQADVRENMPAAPAPAARETRTEYHDIEFETVTHRTEERITRETVRDMKEIVSRLENQERELGRLRAVQEKMAGRNLKGEVLKKLEEQAQMERLRGGR